MLLQIKWQLLFNLQFCTNSAGREINFMNNNADINDKAYYIIIEPKDLCRYLYRLQKKHDMFNHKS